MATRYAVVFNDVWTGKKQVYAIFNTQYDAEKFKADKPNAYVRSALRVEKIEISHDTTLSNDIKRFEADETLEELRS